MHRFCRLIFAIILAAWLLTGCSGAGTNEIQHASQSDPTSSSIFTDYGVKNPAVFTGSRRPIFLRLTPHDLADNPPRLVARLANGWHGSRWPRNRIV